MATYGAYDNPRYVVTVLVEHGGHGGSEGGQLRQKFMKSFTPWDISNS